MQNKRHFVIAREEGKNRWFLAVDGRGHQWVASPEHGKRFQSCDEAEAWMRDIVGVECEVYELR